MEGLEPITQADQASFCVEMLKRLNMQREQDYLCEITLVAKEGKQFKAHKNVLSAASPFFVKLLQTEMKEKEEAIARFEEISEPILEKVLEFIYTGQVKIDDEQTAEDLIIAADYLLLVCLKTTAGRFLEQRLVNTNCISTFYFAEKYHCEELTSNSKKFVLDNFAFVAESDEFLKLESHEVERWISNDEICVANEEDVFKIIENWIAHSESDRKSKFEELFQHVRLVLFSRDTLLLDVATKDFVTESHPCVKRLLDAVKMKSYSSEDSSLQSPRTRLTTNAIVVYGLYGGTYTLCYLPEKNKWRFLAQRSEDQYFSRGLQVVIYRDQLFAFSSPNVVRYDPSFGCWSTLRHIRRPSDIQAVAVVGRYIYAISVQNTGDSYQSTVSRYNEDSLSWDDILTSYEGCRTECCIVVAGKCIYVLGGVPIQQGRDRIAVAHVERFDTVQNSWDKIVDMQQERCMAFGLGNEGKVFVAGGEGKERRWSLKTCEVYTISTNEWQFIGDLHAPLKSGSMLCVNGTMYVLGGLKQKGNSYCHENNYTVESYDPTLNEWTEKTCIPIDRIPQEERNCSFEGVGLKIPKALVEECI
ncbi:kelch-like protein 2 [Montipora foliosa]|uniref:kelch-like protein 2 n=1 Tax=Montipora foliosa TaxID=591990 RepID=UPI0035F1F4AF